MQPARPQPRAPGSFSPLAPSTTASTSSLGQGGAGVPARPPPRRVESSSSEDSIPLPVVKSRAQSGASGSGVPSAGGTSATPIYAQFATQQPNASSNSLQNFSRPTISIAAARASGSSVGERAASPLTPVSATSKLGHSRKHSQTAGLFEPTLPSTSTSNLSQVGSMGPPHSAAHSPDPSNGPLTASKIAAQAAVMHHQQQNNGNGSLHMRQRSQTVPVPGGDPNEGSRRGSGAKPGPLNTPTLSLTEASAPRESGFGNQGYHNGLLGSHATAAATAANIAFPTVRSGQSSPGLPTQNSPQPPPPLQILPPEKPIAKEKSRTKLFSRPGKIGTKGEPKEKPLPSPGKIGSALASLQRGNFSTSSLVDSSAQSLYSLANSSSATIRAVETPIEDKSKDKERKHHFLSRGKHKLSGKDDYHLPLSSAASNSRPSDPSAPSSLYSFNLPPSPGPNSTSFSKSMSGLHAVKRDKRGGERSESRLDTESSFSLPSEWSGGSSSVSGMSHQNSMYGLDPIDSGKYGLNNMQMDDAWPYLKAKLLVIFEGEDLRLPVEDFNRVVNVHIRYCIDRRAPNIIVEDLRELLATGFASLDRTLRKTPEDRVIPALVELWLFTFTSILPYMQAVFLPLDLEFAGCGQIMTPEQARDFWGGVLAASPADTKSLNINANSIAAGGPQVSPAASVLDVRRLVLTAYRDIVILPRYDALKAIFSRLSLEFLPASLASVALASPVPITDPATALLSSSPAESFMSSSLSNLTGRPGTAMSLDPSVASYNSSSTTLLGEGSNPSRSRAISNVSYGSGASGDDIGAGLRGLGNSTPGGLIRPFTPSSLQMLGSGSGSGSVGSLREQNVEDSKQVTEMVGRMLQCMSVLAGIGIADGGDEGNRKMEELCKLLKLNWLGRGRTGRNRRGIVGGRVRREEVRQEIGAL